MEVVVVVVATCREVMVVVPVTALNNDVNDDGPMVVVLVGAPRAIVTTASCFRSSPHAFTNLPSRSNGSRLAGFKPRCFPCCMMAKEGHKR